jgi:hypothetical protein
MDEREKKEETFSFGPTYLYLLSLEKNNEIL